MVKKVKKGSEQWEKKESENRNIEKAKDERKMKQKVKKERKNWKVGHKMNRKKERKP